MGLRRDGECRTRGKGGEGENEKGGRRENSKPRVYGAAHAMTSRFAETWPHRWLPAPVADMRDKIRRARRAWSGRGRGGEGGERRAAAKRYKAGRALLSVLAGEIRLPGVRFFTKIHASTCVLYTCAGVCVICETPRAYGWYLPEL